MAADRKISPDLTDLWYSDVYPCSRGATSSDAADGKAAPSVDAPARADGKASISVDAKASADAGAVSGDSKTKDAAQLEPLTHTPPESQPTPIFIDSASALYTFKKQQRLLPAEAPDDEYVFAQYMLETGQWEVTEESDSGSDSEDDEDESSGSETDSD
jgi:hypothetical protein